MRKETETLQRELDRLSAEIMNARRDLRRVLRRRVWTGQRAVLLGAALFTISGVAWWNVSAQSNSEPEIVRAPFTVVDKDGKTIFQVEDPHRIYVANAAGKLVAEIADYGGGQITARADNNANISTVMFASAAGLGMSVFQNSQVVFIGEERVSPGKGKPTEKTNHGAAHVFIPSQPKARAALTFTDHRGTAAVYDISGKPIAALTESDKVRGVGRLKISSATVDGVFSAGATGKGGEACAKRGVSLACLQPGLPLSIQVPNKP